LERTSSQPRRSDRRSSVARARTRGWLARLLAALALGAPAFARQETPPQATKPETTQATPPEKPQETPPAPPARPAPTPPHVQAIHVEGEQRYTEAQLIAALGQRVGQLLDMGAIDAGLKKLWTSFHVRVEVEYIPVDHDTIELTLHVEEMPVDREPRFTGNSAIDDKTLRKWALLDEKSELYLYQAGRVRQRLLEGYHREGFYWAEVNAVARSGVDENGAAVLPDVIFEIREGPKVRVKKFVFEGNKSMPDTRFLYFFKDGLSHLAQRSLEGPTLFNWFGAPFVQETLDADIQAMRQVYRDRGWLDALVELEPLEFNAARDHVTIHVRIDEGERYHVSKLSVQGVEWVDPENFNDPRTKDVELMVPEADLVALCKMQPGELYEKNTLQKDVSALRTFYGNRGHISHESLPRRVNWSFEPPDLAFDVEQHTVAVTYRLAQGRELSVREIVFAGAHHTRDRVLRRELSVFEGQRADLGEIDKSLARVQATSFFSDDLHKLEHRDPSYRFLPVEGDPSKVDLEVAVDEGRVIDFQISGGIDSNDGAFGIVSLTMRNFDISDLPSSFWSSFSEIYHKEAFHGAGQYLQLEVAPGTQVSRFRVHFKEPDIFRTHLRPVSFDIDLQKRDRRYNDYDEDRYERKVQLGRKLTHDLFIGVGYTYADIDVSNLNSSGVPPLLDLQERQGTTTLAGPTLDLTTRSLDNVYTPHSGYSARMSTYFYTTDLGSDYDVTRYDLRTDWYTATGEKADGTKPVLHFELDGGVADPYADTSSMPYTDRFFLGGTQSMRGFDYRGVGPFDPLSGDALGGETYISGTLEWLYPLHSQVQPGTFKRIESLRGGLFLDFGLLNTNDWTVVWDDMRVSAGISFGLSVPLPLSINFGFPIREQSGDQKQVFSFTLGFGL
jgi:outer membrane protein insertion porin family